VPFGPFHPTLDEPAHFRLYVEGEMVRGCEYRGFMAHRGIEKLGESVLTYNEIPMAAERICGICGCVHNVAYAQAVENAVGIMPPPRSEYIRTIMLEWNGCTVIYSGLGLLAISAALTPCLCTVLEYANRLCGLPRKFQATAKPTHYV
jgi:Ni,Fe-hydrogenase III large subunit